MNTNNGKIDPNYQISLDKLTDLALTNGDTIRSVALGYSSILQNLIEEHQKNLTYISTLEKILKETDKALERACYYLCTYCDGCEDRSLKYTDEQLKKLMEEEKVCLLSEVQNGK